MENFDVEKLVRENIKKLRPYSSARSEYRGNAEVFIMQTKTPTAPLSKKILIVIPILCNGN